MGLISRVSSRTYRKKLFAKMPATWKHYLISVALLMIFDVCWIKFYFSGPYFEQVKEIQGTDLVFKMPPAIAAYTFMIIGLFVITIPNIDATTNKTLFLTILQFGTALGSVIYGTYAFTCAAIFTNFTYSIAIQDTVWGTFLYTVVPLITFVLVRAFENKPEESNGRNLID